MPTRGSVFASSCTLGWVASQSSRRCTSRALGVGAVDGDGAGRTCRSPRGSHVRTWYPSCCSAVMGASPKSPVPLVSVAPASPHPGPSARSAPRGRAGTSAAGSANRRTTSSCSRGRRPATGTTVGGAGRFGRHGGGVYPAVVAAADFDPDGVLAVELDDEPDDEHAATTSAEARTSVGPMAAVRRTGVSVIRATRRGSGNGEPTPAIQPRPFTPGPWSLVVGPAWEEGGR